MIDRLIQLSLRQRLFMLLLVAVLAAAGGIAFRGLPIDAFPDVSSPQVKMVIKAPGMTPEEVEARITAPVEVEMLGIPNQVMLRSMAKYGLTTSPSTSPRAPTSTGRASRSPSASPGSGVSSPPA